MNFEIPAIYGIAIIVGSLVLLYAIKKIGPYYMEGLEVVSGMDMAELSRFLVAVVLIVACIGSLVGGVAFIVKGTTKISDPETYAVKEAKQIKKEKQKTEAHQILIEKQKQKGINQVIIGSGALLGIFFLAWTSIVLINYDTIARRLS